MIISAWMIALAPWLMDLFRGGRYNRADAAGTTHLFVLLSLTLPLWAVQGIYARAFYAAGDTRTPAITGTIITVLSAPMYWALYNMLGMRGLALSSDVGIAVQTLTLAVLLQRHRLVSLLHLEWSELARAGLAAAAAWGHHRRGGSLLSDGPYPFRRRARDCGGKRSVARGDGCSAPCQRLQTAAPGASAAITLSGARGYRSAPSAPQLLLRFCRQPFLASSYSSCPGGLYRLQKAFVRLGFIAHEAGQFGHPLMQIRKAHRIGIDLGVFLLQLNADLQRVVPIDFTGHGRVSSRQCTGLRTGAAYAATR